jgi:hypothetical protein
LPAKQCVPTGIWFDPSVFRLLLMSEALAI